MTKKNCNANVHDTYKWSKVKQGDWMQNLEIQGKRQLMNMMPTLHYRTALMTS
jgi:hypothetical protein